MPRASHNIVLSTLNMYPIKNNILCHVNVVISGSWSENILDYFLRNNQITTEDGAEIVWYHAANHKSQMREALRSKWLLLFLLKKISSFYFFEAVFSMQPRLALNL